MRHRSPVILIAIFALLILGLLLPGGATAFLDPLELQLRQQYPPALRWDNIKGSPFYIQGPAPAYDFETGMHLVYLTPGQSIKVKIPRNSQLRVHSKAFPASQSPLRFMISRGLGLLVEAVPIPGEDGRDLLIIPPESSSHVCTISNPETSADTLTFGLFLSRFEAVIDIAPYRDNVDQMGTNIALSKSGNAGTKNFSAIPANEKSSFQINGPARIKVESRVLYSDDVHQRRREYSIHTELNGIPFGNFEYITTPNEAQVVAVDDEYQPIGRSKTGFLDIPEGNHSLSLQSTAPIAIRVSRLQSPDYFVSPLNSPSPPPEEIMKQRLSRAQRLSLWQVSTKEIEAARKAPASEPEKTERVAWRLARDNSTVDGGLLARDLMARAADAYPAYSDIRGVKAEISAISSGFRNLLPTSPRRLQQQALWIAPLSSKENTYRGMALSDQLLEDSLGQIGDAVFTRLEGDDPLEYRLPERSAPTLIRLFALYPSQKLGLTLQMDDGKKTSLVLLPSVELPETDFRPSLGTAALAVSAMRSPGLDTSTLGGPFGAEHYPAPLVSPAMIELPLPPNVKKLSLALNTEAVEGVDVAVRLLRANQNTLSEKAYLERIETMGGNNAALEEFQRTLASAGAKNHVADEHPFSSTEIAILDLKNDWIPIIRHLRALDAQFRAGVAVDPNGISRNGHRPRLHKNRADAERSARKNIQLGNMVLAIEDWAEVVRLSTASEQDRTKMELSKALLAAGEEVLALYQLKGLFLFSADPLIRDQAHAQLRLVYEKSGEVSQLLPLEATRFLLSPNRDQAAALAVCLAENTYNTEALKLGLLAVKSLDDTSAKRLYATALSEKWVHAGPLFSSRTNEAFSQAMELLSLNDPQQALPFFAEAGSVGQPYVHAIEAGQDILKRLQESDFETRKQAILDWEQWQWSHPGGREETSLAQSVTEHGGAMLMKSKTRGLTSSSYIAAPGRPVKARIYGPLTVRIVTRPIHISSFPEELEGWLEVRDKDQLHLAPINNNWPSAGLAIEGHDALPGRAVELVKTFGPGPHEVTISGQDLTLAVQLFAQRPSLPISILPPMTPENVGMILMGTNTPQLIDAPKESEWRLGEEPVIYAAKGKKNQCVASQSIVDGLLALALPAPIDNEIWAELATFRSGHSRASDSIEKHYVAKIASYKDSASAIKQTDSLKKTGIPMSVVRLYDDSGKEWFVVQSLPYDSSDAAKKCIAQLKNKGIKGQLGEISPELMRQRVVAGYMPPQECPSNMSDETMAIALGRGEFDKALALTSEETPQQILTKMAILVRLGENDSERLIEVESRAQELYERHTDIAGLKALLSRLSGLTAWRSVTSIQSSAGVRYVPTSSWQNESPYVRARQAVFGPVHKDEILLQGVNPIAYTIQSLETEDVVLNLELPRAPHQNPINAMIAWQIDNGDIKRTELTSNAPARSVHLKVSKGYHSLRVWIDNPKRNQFVRVQLHNPRGAGHVDASGAYFERRYFVATPNVPVVATIKGPAWVRVDELKGQRTFFSYRSIGEGWHEIRLQPTEEAEALYRISSRGISPVGKIAGMAPESPDYTEMPAPPFKLATAPAPSAVIFRDDFALGGQEDGTWELETSAVKRRDVGEDTGSKDAEQFLQLSVRHRYYADTLPAYFKTEILARKHEFGGPTIGLLEDFTYLPRSIPLTFNLAGSLYLQAPKSRDVYWGAGRTEWSAYLRGRVSQKRDFNDKSYHVPTTSIFVRALSMKNDSRYKGKELDRDVYTDYKNDHKIGWRIGDTLYHRPFLDTLLYGGASVTTNEQMNLFAPDHISLRTGWSQLFGAVQTDLGYRFTHYYSDKDRSGSSNKDFLDFGAHWDYWLENQDRIRLGFKTEYDLDLGQPSGALKFSWFWNDGRGLKDFRPQAEERFHDLKERAVPSIINNAVDYVLEQ